MKIRSGSFLGLSLAAAWGCGGSAVLLESPGDSGATTDGTTTSEAASEPVRDGGGLVDGASAMEASCVPGQTHCIAFDATPPPLLDSSSGGGGGDAAACPTGISWAGPGPGLGQPCPTEGQVCEDDSCKNNCAEPCNSVQCFECDALQCVKGTWQGATVQLENCDAGVHQTTAPSCGVATDCRLFSNYCANASNACTCEVLGAGDPDPACDAGQGECLHDPCDGITVVCDQSLHCAMQ